MLLNGSEKADVLTGGAEADTLYGFGGNDKLVGAAGDDVLAGMAGNDTLQGGEGDDYLMGGAGSDTLEGGNGVDWAAYEDATSGVTVSLAITTAQNTGGGGTDKLTSVENLYGSQFNDVLTGDANTNFLAGGDGNDSLLGGAGEDHLQGGAGNDTINGGSGHDMVSYDDGVVGGVYIDLRQELQDVSLGAHGQDRLISVEAVWGSSYDDTLIGNNDANYLYGGAGNDNLMANGGGDVLEAADGDDHLLASGTGPGGDLLLGGAGNDTFDTEHAGATLDGGEGDDLFRLGEPTGLSVVIGGDGVDTLGFHAEAGPTAGVNVDLSIAGDQQIGVGQVLNLSSIENLVGTAFGDRLSGDANANRLLGGAGDDDLTAVGGGDVLDGGDGDDQLHASQVGSGDYLSGGAGEDVFFTQSGAATLDGGAGDDSFYVMWSPGMVGVTLVRGGEGSDTLELMNGSGISGAVANLSLSGAQDIGGGQLVDLQGVENIGGGMGNDVLTGEAGANKLWGGFGDDTLIGGAGNDVLDGGAGVDTVSYADGVMFGMQADLGVEDQSVSNTARGYDRLFSIENVIGSDFGDIFHGSGDGNRLEGRAGNDTLYGHAGNDTLIGGQGHDYLIGGSGLSSTEVDTYVFNAGDSSHDTEFADIVLTFDANDLIKFSDGVAASSSNYVEISGFDMNAVMSYVTNAFASEGTRYVVAQIDRDFYVFADTGEEGGTYDQVVRFAESNLDRISMDSIIVI